MDLQQNLNLAIQFHQGGHLADADRLYREILAADPGNFTVLHLMGIMRLQVGQNAEALKLIRAALAINPGAAEAWSNCGNVLKAMGRFDEALESYERALTITPNDAEALNSRGTVLQGLKRYDEALGSYDLALAADPGGDLAWSNRGNTLSLMQRLTDAVASFDKALAIAPSSVLALLGRASALQSLKRHAEALESYDKVLLVDPSSIEALNNRGNVLRNLKQFDQALASYDRALARKPDGAEIWNNRGTALQALARFDEALASYDKALALHPAYAEALNNRGAVLCESGRTEEGLAAYRHSAAKCAPAPHGAGVAPPHKAWHDQEQRDYLSTQSGDAALLGARLAGPAINPGNNANEIETQWRQKTPQVVVIDNFLTDTALAQLRRYCWGAPIWHDIYEGGYLGTRPELGFACPLLAQIAEELRHTFTAIFRSHPLLYLWAFKYDNKLAGTNVHADFAAVNVNFWITPDEANLESETGGLVIWDAAAPRDWDFDKYNGDIAASRDFLARSGAQTVTIPHRANRAVIFDSDLFHETDQMHFKNGYQNRRINVTLLYGRRDSKK